MMDIDDKYKICLDHATRLIEVLIDQGRINTNNSIAVATSINNITAELYKEWK